MYNELKTTYGLGKEENSYVFFRSYQEALKAMHLAIVCGTVGRAGRPPGIDFSKNFCKIPTPEVNIACQIPLPRIKKYTVNPRKEEPDILNLQVVYCE